MIFFNIEEARDQLLKTGIVYTLRPKPRREGTDLAVNGSYFKNNKIGKVAIKYMGSTSELNLENYRSKSGFERLSDWLRAAKGSLYLYEVKII
ncbi:hypothetical protein ES703_71433 [subsurface metagenome]